MSDAEREELAKKLDDQLEAYMDQLERVDALSVAMSTRLSEALQAAEAALSEQRRDRALSRTLRQLASDLAPLEGTGPESRARANPDQDIKRRYFRRGLSRTLRA